MVFSSPIFLFFFLPLTIVLYFLSPRKLKNVILLSMSLLFYAWGEGAYILFLFISVAMNYFFGIAVARYTRKKVWLIISSIVNIGMLGVFKYAGFFVENINVLFGLFGNFALSIPHIRLPIGISFFTFQALSYVIDVYRQKVNYQKNILKLGLYISLFPQLIAGPIVRYSDVAEQIDTRAESFDLFVSGISRFIVGLAKKAIIANTLAEVADHIFMLPISQIDIWVAWLGIFCYAFQIYFDFSGYSDMAIGLGRMFGFRFLENFNYPYISQSIQEFWRRWHISLSSWFRDYLYIPLGGSRVASYRIYLNIGIVFLLTGFWHGASWSFVVWGIYFGLFLILERLGLGVLLQKTWRPIRHIYALFVVIIGWVFFRVETLGGAFAYLNKLLGFSFDGEVVQYIPSFLNTKVLLILFIALISSIPIIPAISDWYYKKNFALSKNAHGAVQFVVVCALLGIFVISLMLISSGTYNPFIYFRF